MTKVFKTLMLGSLCLLIVAAMLAQPKPPGPPNAASKGGAAGPPAHVTLPPQAGTPGPPAHVTLPPQAGTPGPKTENPTQPASKDATVNVIHGVPNLGPVTVCALGGESEDDAVLVEDAAYKDIASVALAAGAYELQVFPGPGCSGDPIFEEPLALEVGDGENWSVVAHLTEDSEAAISIFHNSLAAALPGYARASIHHLAALPAVQATIQRLTESALDMTTGAVSNGTMLDPGQIRPGMWEIELFKAVESAEEEPAALSESVLGPAEVLLNPKTLYLLYVVGEWSENVTELELLILPVALPIF
ncbi:MAG: hypothetical protein KJZ84_21595 [Bryobacteraceae bacterium]|nr:hypothetical protein [Bryobacteraceae bacterium]